MCRLDLAQHLRLTENLTLERRRYAEDPVQRRSIEMDTGVGANGARRLSRACGEQSHDRLRRRFRIGMCALHLDSIARRQDDCLANPGMTQVGNESGHLRVGDENPVA